MKRRSWYWLGGAIIGLIVVLAGLSYGLARQTSWDAWIETFRFDRPLIAQLNVIQRAYADYGDQGCLAELATLDVDFRPPKTITGPNWCGIANAVRLTRIGSATLDHAAPLSCSMALALSRWQLEEVQPLAQKSLGSPIKRILHFGTYNCRTIRGDRLGLASQHAYANALDISGFKLANGKTLSILYDWPKSPFLHQIAAQACTHFSTTLSPESNPNHRDHLHLDQGIFSTCAPQPSGGAN